MILFYLRCYCMETLIIIKQQRLFTLTIKLVINKLKMQLASILLLIGKWSKWSIQLPLYNNVINQLKLVMVIVNYQLFLKEEIEKQAKQCRDHVIKSQISSKQFEDLILHLYEYCQELNIIKRRIEKLKFQTDKNQIVMPKLIESQITRIDTKAKQISTAYSMFLLKQKKFKVLSNQSKHFEEILKVIVKLAVQKCFLKQDSEHLTKEVNRLFRTNTFNTDCCWKSYIDHSSIGKLKVRKSNPAQTNFRVFRRTVYSESSQIKPYVNNKTCFKSLKSRSPVISLWYPNSEYLSFSLARKDRPKNKFQL